MSGQLDLFGQNVSNLSRAQLAMMRRQIGVVFQDFRLIHLTVYQNVTLPLRIAGKRETAYRDNVTELLRWVGLGQQMNNKPETLSGGEKQRAAIARAVIARPRLIVADEPTGNVDPEMGIRLLRLLDELNKMGTTILIATHDNYIWSSLTTRACILKISTFSACRRRPFLCLNRALPRPRFCRRAIWRVQRWPSPNDDALGVSCPWQHRACRSRCRTLADACHQCCQRSNCGDPQPDGRRPVTGCFARIVCHARCRQFPRAG